jgi:hypothetical protein
MSKLNGIIHDPDGNYVHATIERGSGKHKAAHVVRWSSRNVLRRFLLMTRSVTFGLASRWQTSSSSLQLETMVKAEGPSEQFGFPCGFESEYQLHYSALEACLEGIVPDYAYLTTLPLAFGTAEQPSFVTLHCDDDQCRIGITVEGGIAGNFTFPGTESSAIISHLGRIERFWKLRWASVPFPTSLYHIGPIDIAFQSEYAGKIREMELPEGMGADIGSLQAVGAALAGESKDIARFCGPTQASRRRTARRVTLAAGLALVIGGIAAAVTPALVNNHNNRKLRQYKQAYQEVLVSNKEIRSQIKQNDYLARSVLRLRKTLAHQTSWARLLEALGEKRPATLHLQRLGSMPVEGRSDRVRIALTGSSEEIAHVTELIARLQKLPFITDARLSTMERDSKNPKINRFKILCVLHSTRN